MPVLQHTNGPDKSSGDGEDDDDSQPHPLALDDTAIAEERLMLAPQHSMFNAE